MSVSVASQSAFAQQTASASPALVLTAPTGIQVGDLLVADLCVYSNGSVTPSVSSTGWTASGNTGSSGDPAIKLMSFFKFAVSGDTTASSYTFSGNANVSAIGGKILRVTGNSTFNPQVTYGETDLSKSVVSVTSLTPTYDNSLIIVSMTAFKIFLHGGAGTFSAYTINGTNPAWTSQGDETVQDYSGYDTYDARHGIASAIMATKAAITSFGASGANADASAFAAIIHVISPRVDATGTAPLTTLTLAPKAPNGIAGTTGTATLTTLTADAPDASGSVSNKTWTTIPKS